MAMAAFAKGERRIYIDSISAECKSWLGWFTSAVIFGGSEKCYVYVDNFGVGFQPIMKETRLEELLF